MIAAQVQGRTATKTGSGTVFCETGARPLSGAEMGSGSALFAVPDPLSAKPGRTITVKGNASNLGFDNGRYWLFAPPHVNPATGAMRGTNTGATFEPEYNTSYLWGLYRYQPPMTGFYVDPDGAPTAGVYGAQTGTNQAGTYHAGAREYDPSTGRWTTPDPAMSPWANLWDYVGNDPAGLSDPTGLSACARYLSADFVAWLTENKDNPGGKDITETGCERLKKAQEILQSHWNNPNVTGAAKTELKECTADVTEAQLNFGCVGPAHGAKGQPTPDRIVVYVEQWDPAAHLVKSAAYTPAGFVVVALLSLPGCGGGGSPPAISGGGCLKWDYECVKKTEALLAATGKGMGAVHHSTCEACKILMGDANPKNVAAGATACSTCLGNAVRLRAF